MPEGRSQAFLCLSFVSHEGRRWVGVNGHILALCFRGPAMEAFILYCQAVLLTFLKIYLYLTLFYPFVVVLFWWLLLFLFYITTVDPCLFCSFQSYHLLICCTRLLFFYISWWQLRDAGARLLSSLDWPITLRTCGGVIFIVHFKDKD